MHRGGTLGILPLELTYSGYNFDIVTGILALFFIVCLKLKIKVSTQIIYIFNMIGTLCLIIILFVAISATPLFMFFGEAPEKLNTWVAYAPYVLVPTYLVNIAIVSHIIIWRKLLSVK